MGESTVERVQEKSKKAEREALENTTEIVIERVLKIAREREIEIGKGSNPNFTVEPVDLAILTIKYGTFSEEGFFKILRNTSFGWTLAISLIAGLLSWFVLNLKNIFLPLSS